MWIPAGHHLLVQALVELVSVLVRQDDSLQISGVVHWLDATLRVLDQVVVALKSSALLVLHHDLTDLKEEIVDGRVLTVPLGGTVDSARTLVDLNEQEHVSDQLFALGDEVLLIQMDSEVLVVANDLELEDV